MSFLKRILFTLLVLCAYSCGSNSESKKSISEEDSIVKSDTPSNGKNEDQTYDQSYDKALQLFSVPYEEIDLKTSFGNAHVIMCGPKNGDPMVLLHGMNASSTMWYPNIQSLSNKYRVYAIDFLLEPNKSTSNGEINNTVEIVSWYHEIFDQLKLNNINLVGASRGGWLSINIALDKKKYIKKIVLLSPAQSFIWIRPSSEIVTNISYSISPKRKKLREALETMTNDVDKISQVYINQYYIATQEAKISPIILQMTPFSEKQLKSLTIPVLVLVGDNDIINNQKSLEIASKYIPKVETGTIKNAGHFLSIDQPEIVNKKILDFLKK